MAYFANSCEGDHLENQCARCPYGKLPCPIYYVQMEYNYDYKIEIVKNILDSLIGEDGDCYLLKLIEKKEAENV